MTFHCFKIFSGVLAVLWSITQHGRAQRKRILSATFSSIGFTKTGDLKLSSFSCKTHTFENAFQSGDIWKRRISSVHPLAMPEETENGRRIKMFSVLTTPEELINATAIGILDFCLSEVFEQNLGQGNHLFISVDSIVVILKIFPVHRKRKANVFCLKRVF